MANVIIDLDDVEMETYCEPDSTVEIIDHEAESANQEQTPLEIVNLQLVETQHVWSSIVEASIRDRNRIRADLQDARIQRENVSTEFVQMFNLNNSTERNVMNLKASIEQAIRKRCALLKDIETEKMWRPPSVEMCLKKQQELRERVEHMRAILGTGRIRTPDDSQLRNEVNN